MKHRDPNAADFEIGRRALGVMRLARRGVAALAVLIGCSVASCSKPPPVRDDSVLIDSPSILQALEARGWSFARVVEAKRFAVIENAVAADMAEFTAGAPPDSRQRLFQVEWLRRGRFQLVGVVNRIDRRTFDTGGCGEVRFVYRLSLHNPRRPVTRLPMTANVRIPQPRRAGEEDCRGVAARWLAQGDLVELLRELPPYASIEINYQAIHLGTTTTQMDDKANYVLRAFRVEEGSLVADGLFNTPRADLDDSEKSTLLGWIGSHLDEIDNGAAVVPEGMLARRSISVSPRGLIQPENRPFARLIPDPRSAFEGFSLEGRKMIRTPELLLRRLDEMTCPGCHQTRGVAGFHLLGEDLQSATVNALAVGHSSHLGADLEWRRADLASVAEGDTPRPRPFAAYPEGRRGAECGLIDGLRDWRCESGLVCRDIHHGEWGVCAEAKGGKPGAPCEDVTFMPGSPPRDAIISPHPPDAECPAPTGATGQEPFCAPNWLGFTGGMCSKSCSTLGEVRDGSICAPLPVSGYEADCFARYEPVEKCLERHYTPAWVAVCDATNPCREDYACVRVPGAAPRIGACVPPYFYFSIRVDGPLLDR